MRHFSVLKKNIKNIQSRIITPVHVDHEGIISSSGKNTCKFTEGLKVIKLIQNIKKTTNG